MKQTEYEIHPIHHKFKEILNKLDEDNSGDDAVRELRAIFEYLSWTIQQSDVVLSKDRRLGCS